MKISIIPALAVGVLVLALPPTALAQSASNSAPPTSAVPDLKGIADAIVADHQALLASVTAK